MPPEPHHSCPAEQQRVMSTRPLAGGQGACVWGLPLPVLSPWTLDTPRLQEPPAEARSPSALLPPALSRRSRQDRTGSQGAGPRPRAVHPGPRPRWEKAEAGPSGSPPGSGGAGVVFGQRAAAGEAAGTRADGRCVGLALARRQQRAVCLKKPPPRPLLPVVKRPFGLSALLCCPPFTLEGFYGPHSENRTLKPSQRPVRRPVGSRLCRAQSHAINTCVSSLQD